MNIIVKLAVAAAALSALCGHSHAQAPKAKNNPAPMAQATPAPTAAATEGANTSAPPPGWVTRCSSASRSAPLECAIEQSAVLTKTGQLIVLINIRVSAETRAPVALVQLPLGLNLPAGAKFQGRAGRVEIRQAVESGGRRSAGVLDQQLTFSSPEAYSWTTRPTAGP